MRRTLVLLAVLAAGSWSGSAQTPAGAAPADPPRAQQLTDVPVVLHHAVGLNAQTEQYEDLVKIGVIDPTKVARTALQNASSVAGLMLTTDAMVAELVEEKKGGGGGHSHGMPDMGGMGGMDM